MRIAARRYVFPEPGDTLGLIAKRVLPDVDDGAQLLLSWNLHLAMRPVPDRRSRRAAVYRHRLRGASASREGRDDSEHPVIAAHRAAAGHDGRAEIVLELAYPNGARTQLSVTEEAMARALDVAGVDLPRGSPRTAVDRVDRP